jgi:hypothetical protein
LVRETVGSPQDVDHAEDDEHVFELLDNLQEKISKYEVCSLTDVLLRSDEDSRGYSKRHPTIKNSDRS